MIQPPKDAEGREIPRNTEVMYDINGKKVHVTSFTYKCDVHSLWSQWKVFSPDIKGEKEGMLPADSLYLTPPDSWEKLEEDLRRGANADYFQSCHYAHGNARTCDKCQFYADSNGVCERNVLADVASRINKLRSKS